MKTLKMLALSAVIVLPFAGAEASAVTREAARLCKSEAARQFGTAGDPVRVKFKQASGPRFSPRVRLQVIPEHAEAFNATCEVDARDWVVVSLAREGEESVIAPQVADGKR